MGLSNRVCGITILLWALIGSHPVLIAQTNLTRIFGPEDQTIPAPADVSAAGRDPNALQLLLAFSKAVNSSSWAGFQASGTYTAGRLPSAAATLTLSKGAASRLDVSEPTGVMSIRNDGRSEVIEESGGTRHAVPATSAAGGFIAISDLLSFGFLNANTRIADRGAVVVDGKSLERITIVQPIGTQASGRPTKLNSVLDLYFDPSSHLLVKSARDVQADSRAPEPYLQVITYSDYRDANGVTVPFSYVETLNGQPVWTLQLTEVGPPPTVDAAFFHF